MTAQMDSLFTEWRGGETVAQTSVSHVRLYSDVGTHGLIRKATYVLVDNFLLLDCQWHSLTLQEDTDR